MHFLPDRTKMESESEEDLAEQAELFSTPEVMVGLNPSGPS